jgi:hypothetical protein
MLLDWSSILPRPTGGVSQVALPVVESLLTGNLMEARQLIFAQMLVSGQSSSGDEKVLIGKRNEHAINVLTKSLDQVRGGKHALLFGTKICLVFTCIVFIMGILSPCYFETQEVCTAQICDDD